MVLPNCLAIVTPPVPLLMYSATSISDVMPLERVPDGVRRLAEKEGDPVRLVVQP